MKTCVIGASGFVGSYLFDFFSKRKGKGVNSCIGTYCNNKKEGLIRLNIANAAEVEAFLEKEKPQVVLVPAANPNVEWCETNPQESWNTNVQAIINVVDSCKKIGAKMVYYSTEYVFDGTSGPYSEEDIPNPISVYGFHKYTAETYMREVLPDSLSLRTTVVYGWESTGKNFVDRFVKTLQAKESFRVPKDQISSPTYVECLVEATDALLQKNSIGIYNVTGSEVMDRYQFAMSICEVFSLDKTLVNGALTSELGQKARRPLKAGLLVNKLIKDTGYTPRNVKSGLELMRSKERSVQKETK